MHDGECSGRKQHKILTLSLFILLAYPASFAKTTIVGGRKADIEEFPWQVILGMKDAMYADIPYVLSCGGSILGDEWVVTAKHCFLDQESLWQGKFEFLDSVTVFSGIDSLGVEKISIDPPPADLLNRVAPTKGISSQKIIMHPKADLALIKLSQKLTLGPRVQAIPYAGPLHAAAGLLDSGVIAITSGWGDTVEYSFCEDEINGCPSYWLKTTQLPLVPLAVADRLDSYYGTLAFNHLPAGYLEGGDHPCHGDSGGPLAVPNADGNGLMLAGIVSFGDGCLEDSPPGITTNLSYYADWIEANTGIAPGHAADNHILFVRVKGNGKVESPAGIDCRAHCREMLAGPGAAVTLHAVPDEGWLFKGWSGACQGTDVCTYNAASRKNVFATFEIADFFPSLSLVNRETGGVIQQLSSENTISLDKAPKLNVSVQLDNNNIEYVLRFQVTGQSVFSTIDKYAPYAMFSNFTTEAQLWDTPPSPGTYEILISAYHPNAFDPVFGLFEPHSLLGLHYILHQKRITMTFVEGPVSARPATTPSPSWELRTTPRGVVFHTKKAERLTVSVHTLDGKKLRSEDSYFPPGSHPATYADMPRGMYIIQIKSRDGKSLQKLFGN